MDAFEEMMVLVGKEASVMHNIEKHLQKIRDLNIEESKVINKKINDCNFAGKEIEELSVSFSEQQAKEYFSIAQLYLQRASLRKQRLEYLD